MATVLIAGCGDIGSKLGVELHENGHTVYGIRRDISQLPDCIEPIEANLHAPLPEFEAEFDYVYYMASAGKYKDTAYYQAYVQGTRNLLQGLTDQAHIKRIFFISSTSVFSQSDGELVDETAEAEAHGFSSERILEGEQNIIQSNFPATVVRFGGIYGPGRTHLIDLVMEGKAHCVEDIWSNRIHSKDCVGMLMHLMNMCEDNQAVESLYIGVDDQPTPSCEVYEWLAEELNVNFVDHREPTESSRLMRSNKRLSNARIRATGYEFQYKNYQEGYLELLP